MRVTVFGSARVSEGSREYDEGRRLGRLLAERGDTVVSGGYAGAMEAVSRGAHEAKGHVVGVTMAAWAERLTANPYLLEEVSARSLFERLEVLIKSDALIALPGGAGTLGEVALAWNLRQMDLAPTKPIILIGDHWSHLVNQFGHDLIVDQRDLSLLTLVSSVDEAIQALESDRVIHGEWRG